MLPLFNIFRYLTIFIIKPNEIQCSYYSEPDLLFKLIINHALLFVNIYLEVIFSFACHFSHYVFTFLKKCAIIM